MSQVELPRKQTGLLGSVFVRECPWAGVVLHGLERAPFRSTPMEEGMGTGVNRRRSWALMQTIAGLRQPIRSSGDRMTDLSELCQTLRWEDQVSILPFSQSWDMGPPRRVDFGWHGSAAEADLKGADACRQSADHTSRSWASESFTDTGTELPITMSGMLRRSHKSWVVGQAWDRASLTLDPSSQPSFYSASHNALNRLLNVQLSKVVFFFHVFCLQIGTLPKPAGPLGTFMIVA